MKMNDCSGTSAYYAAYLHELHRALDNTEVTDRTGMRLDQEAALMRWCSICRETQLANRTIFFVGNGASATMASHMAADFSKNGNCRAMAFNDVALMTAVSNDIHYSDCFAVPLARFADPEDVLITISSSGNSPNVIRAIEQARTMELPVITISGMRSENISRSLGDLNFWVPADTYGVVEASHQALLHCWLDTFLELYQE